MEPAVVTSIIEKIDDKFVKMTVTRGKSHDFLGMGLNFDEDKTVGISMKEYIKGAITDFPKDIITRNAATPAAKHLFDISD